VSPVLGRGRAARVEDAVHIDQDERRGKLHGKQST
jgi:hypothetical protein